MNPFPGMNPYLESPFQWHGFHNTLIVYLANALNAVMPPAYAARVDDRCRIVQTQRDMYPDVVIKRSTPTPSTFAAPAYLGGGGVAVAPAPAALKADTPLLVEAVAVEPRETYITIVHTAQGNSVVASIELLSPVNKAGGEGQALYLSKQAALLASPVHLIEIDLLRAGLPTVSVGRPTFAAVEQYEYLVCLHRGGGGAEFEVWPNRLRDTLPRIAVPLRDDDPDAVLDLQAVLNRCYEQERFGQQINYAQLPDPPLSTEDAVWADSLLREHGLRTS